MTGKNITLGIRQKRPARGSYRTRFYESVGLGSMDTAFYRG